MWDDKEIRVSYFHQYHSCKSYRISGITNPSALGGCAALHGLNTTESSIYDLCVQTDGLQRYISYL